MTLKDCKLKLSVNKESGELPPYSLTYKARGQYARNVSYTVLSALIGEHDVMIEMHSDLQFCTNGKQIQYVMEFVKGIGAFPVAVRDREGVSDKKLSILGFAIDRKKKEKAYEAIAYVPNAVWRNDSIIEVLPLWGARYYIVKEPMDGEKMVNEFWNMTEEAREGFIEMAVFDIASMGQVGITSRTVGEGELRRMLGL